MDIPLSPAPENTSTAHVQMFHCNEKKSHMRGFKWLSIDCEIPFLVCSANLVVIEVYIYHPVNLVYHGNVKIPMFK